MLRLSVAALFMTLKTVLQSMVPLEELFKIAASTTAAELAGVPAGNEPT
jgi:hypothetical protein